MGRPEAHRAPRDPRPLLTVILEIPKNAWPVRGYVAIGGEAPQPFWGWGEVRRRIHAALGREDAAALLTETETRVVSLVCEGLSNAEVARLLVTSPRTVQGHLYRVFKKLGVKTRAQLVARLVTHPEVEIPTSDKSRRSTFEVEPNGSRDAAASGRIRFSQQRSATRNNGEGRTGCT